MAPVIRSEAGGYELYPLAGFESKENLGMVSMFLPQGDQQSGPGMLFTGSLFNEEVTLDQAAAVMVKIYPEYTFSQPEKITLDGIEGVSMDFSAVYHAPDGIILASPGADEGEALQGRLIVVMVTPNQQFKALMLTPLKSWPAYQPEFEAVMAAVKFFVLHP